LLPVKRNLVSAAGRIISKWWQTLAALSLIWLNCSLHLLGKFFFYPEFSFENMLINQCELHFSSAGNQ
jgi:hypothetical protein